MDWAAFVLWYVALIISLTVHEAAHAFFAMLGGDRTAYYGGQVSLNPVPHMRREPFGMVLLPLLTLYTSGGSACLGYANTPIDPRWAYHHPKKAALMSAAGPLANLLLGAIAFAVLAWVARPDGDIEETIRKIAGVFLHLNLLLAVFNCIPVPPLDGAGIVSGLHPPARRFYEGIERLPYASLVIFVALMVFLPSLYGPVWNTVNGWLPYPWYFRG